MSAPSVAVADDTVELESALSDTVLRQLMAVGQVDVLVWLPTLDNATTVVDVVRAVNASFARDLPRLRTVMITSDGGSTDGTPELIRGVASSDGDMVLTSHSLRTLHRVVAPYHGLPGKHTALRTIFAAADLTRAKTLVVLDPCGPATTPERVTELISPIARAHVEFLAPRYPRHPRDGLLVTQLARPLVRALYGVALDEPLGAEFSCSGRFASHCLEQEIWHHESARFAIDLWLRTEAVARGFTVGQAWRPPPTAGGGRTSLREAVQQVLLALIDSLRAHDRFWTAATGVAELPAWGEKPKDAPLAPAWNHQALAGQARHDIVELRPLLEQVLATTLLARLMEKVSCEDAPLDDELWVSTVYAFLAATRQQRIAVEHLAAMFVPIYSWRASAFMAHTSREPAAVVQARLDSLGQAFERLKPVLVNNWSAAV